MFYFFTSSSNIMLVLGILIPQIGDTIEDSVYNQISLHQQESQPPKNLDMRCLGIWTTVMTHFLMPGDIPYVYTLW